MEFRKPTTDEHRLLLELARIAEVVEPDAWADALKVREMKDGGMGSLEIEGGRRRAPSGVIVPKASVQFTDEDGVEVIATLNADESGAPVELDVWKTDFSPLQKIPFILRRLEG
jgi:hypothetical protein